MSSDLAERGDLASRLQSVLRASPVGLFALDPNGKVTYVNDAAMRLTGLSETPSDGVAWLSTVHLEDRERVYTYWRNFFRDKVVSQIEYRSVLADGTHLSVLGECRPEMDEHGNIVGYVGSVVDITQRKAIEHALRESEEKFRQVANSAFVGMALVADEARFTYVNQALVQMFGYEPSDFAGKDRMGVAEIIPDPAQRIRLLEALQRLDMPEGAPQSIVLEDMCLRHKDGSPRWASMMFSRLYPERPMPRLMVCVDTTDRKCAEEELRKSEAKFRQVANSALVGIAVTDNKEFLYANDALVRMLGYSPEDLAGEDRESATRILVDEGDRSRLMEAHARLDAAENAPQSFTLDNVCLRAKDGTPRWVSLMFSRLFPDRSMPRLIVCVNTTERKQVELERQAFEARMQQAQKIESLGLMAGGVAHDFSNLLMIILGHAELAGVSLTPSSAAWESFKEIQDAANRAAELAQQMLAYSGKGAFVVRPVDLSALVRGLGQLLEATVSRNAMMRYELAPELPPIRADVTQIQQVVMNLITNASEALGDGRGVITLRTSVVEIGAADLRNFAPCEPAASGRFVLLEVSDTGCGMDGPTVSRIFDPFFTTKFTGRGLGLAATLGIVRGHGGGLQVDSAPGRGTTFRLVFPAVAAEAPTVRAEPQSSRGKKRAATILVVDDERGVREAAARMLGQSGFTVLTAADGPEALEVLQKKGKAIDVVLLDLTMPSMNGEETCAAIRALQPDLPVLFMSGYSRPDAGGRPEADGKSNFLQKPFTISSLRDRIDTLIS